MFRFLALAAALCTASATVFFEEDFSGDWQKKWVTGAPAGKEMGKWDVTSGKWFVDEEVNKGLQATEDMRFYSITAKMDKPSTSKGKTLVVQFSAKIENHQYAYCGGGYIKLLPKDFKPETFGGDDDYQIMFGPDLCGCARRAPAAPRPAAMGRHGRGAAAAARARDGARTRGRHEPTRAR